MSDWVTIGIVIDLPEPHATVIRRWRERVGDPQADMIAPHVTLLAPTRVRVADVKAIREHLTEAATVCEPFSMHLSGTGTFRPLSQVVFVQVAKGIAQCELLERAIRSDLLAMEREFPFHPHVTVAHDIWHTALDSAYGGVSDFIARFVVDRFALFPRATDGTWTVEDEFPLGGQVPEMTVQ